MNKTIFGKMPTRVFLSTYWNKLPVHFKNVYPDIQQLAGPEDFMAMAEDEDFQSRLVFKKGGDYPWQTLEGPFEKKQWQKKGLWTLFCHKIELYNEDFFKLRKDLQFLPDWYFDDIMASYSKKNASVGAHYDDYDVFIVQAHGKREWQLQLRPEFVNEEGLDLRLLKNFKPDKTIILEPGDVLYIPSRVGHHGLSLTDSLSYSMGFKSLRLKNVIDFWATEAIASVEDEVYSKIKGNTKSTFLLSDDVVKGVKKRLEALIKDQKMFEECLLSYVTQSSTEESDQDVDRDQLLQYLESGVPFARDTHSKMALLSQGLMAINGRVFKTDIETRRFMETIFAEFPGKSFNYTGKNKALKNLLLNLLKINIFFFTID